MEGPSACLYSKVRFWTDFRFFRNPEIRRHRPVSGVSDKRSQHRRSAAFGGLPSLPPGVHLEDQIGIQNRLFAIIFGIKFWHHFWHAFFPVFFVFLMDFGSHFGSMLAYFLIILHAFLWHRFCIDFIMIFHEFFDAQNHVLYCKTNSFKQFSLFRKSMENP